MDLIERVRVCGLDSFGSEQGSVAGSCELGHEPSDSVMGGQFIE
jgi:hypothetical protein